MPEDAGAQRPIPTWDVPAGSLSDRRDRFIQTGRTIAARVAWVGRPGAALVAAAASVAVAYADHRVGASLPVSHFYYAPIALAAVVFGYAGGALAAAAAVTLYNLSHFALGASAPAAFGEADALRLLLFLAVGLVTARLAQDRRLVTQRDAELRERNAALEALGAARVEFVAAASHELRAPLTVVAGCAERLADPSGVEATDPVRRARTVARLRQAARRLQWSIETLFDSALAESGRLALRLQEAPLDALLGEAAAIVTGPGTGVAEERVVLPPPAPERRVLADRDRTVQVLINLMGNALKYSPDDAQVEVRATAVGEQVRVSVADLGHGIAPPDLARVFDRFYRAADGRVRSTRGTGLGLSIAREIALAHGGDLTVESEPGRGSTFTLTLPAASPAAAHGPT